jgi:hypothetical protein
MAQGNYDHPSYLTRQLVDLDTSTAGANGTSALLGFWCNMRLRKVACTVRTAGTSSGAGNSAIFIYIGTSVQGFTGTALTTTTTTATLGTVALGSSTAGTVVLSTDFDALLIQGGVIGVKNGTDTTGVVKCLMEMYLDPLATWTGPPGS